MAESQTNSQTNNETPDEVLKRLSDDYQEKAQIVNDVNNKIQELNAQLVTAQQNALLALQTLSNAKEQFLVQILNQRNQQLQELQQKSSLPVVEERENNLPK
jgi:hypothetical protein